MKESLPADDAARLEGIFRDYAQRGGKADRLRDVVCAYTDAERQQGKSVERVIISIKEMADRSGLSFSDAPTRNVKTSNPSGGVLSQCVTWSIQRYYEPETGKARHDSSAAPKPQSPAPGSRS